MPADARPVTSIIGLEGRSRRPVGREPHVGPSGLRPPPRPRYQQSTCAATIFLERLRGYDDGPALSQKLTTRATSAPAAGVRYPMRRAVGVGCYDRAALPVVGPLTRSCPNNDDHAPDVVVIIGAVELQPIYEERPGRVAEVYRHVRLAVDEAHPRLHQPGADLREWS